jgi:hypothetical protein
MLGLEKVLIAASAYDITNINADQTEFTIPGTYYFVVPDYTTRICAVVVAGGGGGSGAPNGGGGGGGALQWRNDIPVTAGETLTVVVGSGGRPLGVRDPDGDNDFDEAGDNPTSEQGGITGIYRGGTPLVYAVGGMGGTEPYGGQGGPGSGNNAVRIPYAPLGNADLNSVNGVVSLVTNTNVDDTYYEIPLTFNIYFLGVAYNKVYVGSNGYITFGGGSSIYSGFSGSNPPRPHVLIFPADRRLFQLYASSMNSNTKFVIRQQGGDYAGTGRTNVWEVHFYPDADYFDIYSIVEPGNNAVSPAISNGTNYLTTFSTTAGTGIRISTFGGILANIGGASGGSGGTGGGVSNWFHDGNAGYGGGAGGGGGAAGYLQSTNAGKGASYYTGGVSAGSGYGGGGGIAHPNRAQGGGGVGLKGIGNIGAAGGGGGSSYNGTGSRLSAALNTPIDLWPVDLWYAWGNFINTYGVWTSNRGADDGQPHTIDRVFYAPYAGTYTIEYAADNQLNFFIDGTQVAVTSYFGGSSTVSYALASGSHVLRFVVQNYGAMANWYNNPAGFALTIRSRTGELVWDTRTYRLANAVNVYIPVTAGGTDSYNQNGGNFGGGGAGGNEIEGGYGGNGGARIIWGKGRSYPYNAGDITPRRRGTTAGLILHYDAANVLSYSGGATITDISGFGNHGVISIGYTPGTPPILGDNRVFRFPVWSNTKIDFVADEIASSQTITVEMWASAEFRPSTTNSSGNNGMFFGWYIHDVWSQAGTLGYNTGQGDIYGISSARVQALALSQRWAHYVFVMNVGDYYRNKIYIDGTRETLGQQYSSQYGPYANFNGGNGRIGGWRLENSYQQVMDLGIFKIYNRELTPTEISTLYNENRARFSRTISDAGEVLYLDPGNTSSYPGTGTVVYDISGTNNNATFSSNGQLSWRNQNGGVFDLNNDYGGQTYGYLAGTANSSVDLRNDMTAEIWFKLDSDPGNDWVRIFGKGYYDADRNIPGSLRTFGLWYHRRASLFLYQRYGTANGSGGALNVAQGRVVELGRWYHMAATSSGNTHTLYIDGVGVASATQSFVADSSAGYEYRIGDAGFHISHNGPVGVTRLWNRGLTSAEVLALYNENRSRYQ